MQNNDRKKELDDDKWLKQGGTNTFYDMSAKCKAMDENQGKIPPPRRSTNKSTLHLGGGAAANTSTTDTQTSAGK